MGNSSTKEQRPYGHPQSGPSHHRGQQPASPSFPHDSALPSLSTDRNASSRHDRRLGMRADPLMLGFSSPSAERGERDSSTGEEVRRGTKQEREARRVERERKTRVEERGRSMREEGVDGGYLVTQGVYTGIEDYSKSAVRQLMIERRVAPFWRGLNDHSESWQDCQLIAAALGLPIPQAGDKSLQTTVSRLIPIASSQPAELSRGLTIPSAGRVSPYSSSPSSSVSPAVFPASLPSSSSPVGSPSTSSGMPFRARSNTAATLTTMSMNTSHGGSAPSEIQLRPDPLVDGRPIEIVLYREASECPICFLFYPPYLNRTRCCDQSICSECFVQIKRPSPHPPEHLIPSASDSAAPVAEVTSLFDNVLVSEPSTCPFCVQPEFGVTYEAPAFRRGVAYASQLDISGHPLMRMTSAISSSSSLSASSLPTNGLLSSPTFQSRRRTTSLSAKDSSVITTDRIRPDWAQKLAAAKAQQARRSAAASALHAAAYLMNSGDGRSGFSSFARRNRSRTNPSVPGEGSSLEGAVFSLSALTGLGDRTGRREAGLPVGESEDEADERMGPAIRRTRIDELEDMMVMEAIRLSLVSEDDRQKKENQDSKKAAKAREKEQKKAEKAAKKGLRSGESTESVGSVGIPSKGPFASRGESTVPGKGKTVDRGPSAPLTILGTSNPSAPLVRVPSGRGDPNFLQSNDVLSGPSSHPGSEVYRPSHLRQVSNTSSTASSCVESTAVSMQHAPTVSGPPLVVFSSPASGGEGSDPPSDTRHEFRSLAEMIGKADSWDDESVRVEHRETSPEETGSHLRDESASGAHCTAH